MNPPEKIPATRSVLGIYTNKFTLQAIISSFSGKNKHSGILKSNRVLFISCIRVRLNNVTVK